MDANELKSPHIVQNSAVELMETVQIVGWRLRIMQIASVSQFKKLLVTKTVGEFLHKSVVPFGIPAEIVHLCL